MPNLHIQSSILYSQQRRTEMAKTLFYTAKLGFHPEHLNKTLPTKLNHVYNSPCADLIIQLAGAQLFDFVIF